MGKYRLPQKSFITSTIGANVTNTLQHSVTTLNWNKALGLDVTSHVAIFVNQAALFSSTLTMIFANLLKNLLKNAMFQPYSNERWFLLMAISCLCDKSHKLLVSFSLAVGPFGRSCGGPASERLRRSREGICFLLLPTATSSSCF